MTISDSVPSGEVAPGESDAIGSFDLGAYNESVNVTEVTTTQFSFDASYAPDRLTIDATCQPNSSCSYENRTVNISVLVPSGTEPGTYSGTAVFVFENRDRVERDFNVDVSEDRSWLISNVSISENVSVGDKGQLANLTIHNTGNVDEEFRFDATGNVSRLLESKSNETVYRGQDSTPIFTYNIPADTEFGYYEGQLVVDSGWRNETVNISTMVEDRIRPRIMDYQFPSFMATRSETFQVLADDNLRVANVTAEVFRQVEGQTVNGSETVNETKTRLEFQHMANSNRWQANFETGEINRFYANLTVFDEAGNSVTEFVEFDVEGLNSTHVVNSSFVLPDSFPDYGVNKTVLRNDIDSRVVLQLDYLQHTGNSSDIWVGIKGPNEKTAEQFEGVGDTIAVSSEGEYQLVVVSDQVERYSGKIRVRPPEAHLDNVENITFRGEFRRNMYPREDRLSLRQFQGNVSLVNNSYGVGRFVQVRVQAPAETCKGYRSWTECFRQHGFDLGRVEAVDQENDDLEYWIDRWKKFAALCLLFAAGYWRKENIVGRAPRHIEPNEDEVEIDGSDRGDGLE